MKRKAHERDTEKAMVPYVRLFGLGLLVLTAFQVYLGTTQPQGISSGNQDYSFVRIAMSLA